MIYGVGIDMVEIARIEASLARFGRRFAERVLSSAECREYEQASRPAQFVARRFAAKEALVKAAGTGFRDGLFLRDISVTHDALGKPSLQFSEQAGRTLERLGIGRSHLSISDEREYALACVLLEEKSC